MIMTIDKEQLTMKTVPAAEFKARCLKIMDEVQVTREPVVVTKRGKPIIKLVPVKKASKRLFGALAGEVKIIGDIESPIIPPESWDMLR
jgi:prevent-host-death family protein